MTRSVPRPVRQQWIDFVQEAGADEETAKNVASMIAGDPRLSFAEVETPEDAREVIETAASLIEQFDLTELGLTEEQDQRVKEAMLVAHRYGLVDAAPLESVYGDPSAHALADLPTIEGLLQSADSTIQEIGLDILDGLSDETLADVVTDPVAARVRKLREAPATSVATTAQSVDDRLVESRTSLTGSTAAPSSQLLANIRERNREREASAEEHEESDAESDVDDGGNGSNGCSRRRG